MFPIPLHNLNEMSTYNPITQASYSAFSEIISSRKKFIYKHGMYWNTFWVYGEMPFSIINAHLYLVIFSVITFMVLEIVDI